MKHSILFSAMLTVLALGACDKRDTTVVPPAANAPDAAPGNGTAASSGMSGTTGDSGTTTTPVAPGATVPVMPPADSKK